MKARYVTFAVIALVAGCTTSRLAELRTDEQTAEAVYAATTQATADAKASLATTPATAPGRAEAVKVITASEKAEQTARLALDVARAALDAAQKKDPADPALTTAVAAAVSAIPSPWTPVLASLLPAAIPLLVSVSQSIKLGRAHQTVSQVTQQLEAHKAALANLTPLKPAGGTDAHG